MARPAGLVVAVVIGLALGACSSSDGTDDASATSTTTTEAPASTTAAPDPTTAEDQEAWAEIDAAVAEMGPDVGLLVAEVEPDGTCVPVHAVAPDEPRPTASQFKLFVLGALAEQIAAGEVAWDQTLTVDDAVRSLGNGPGSLQMAPAGTEVTVTEAATKMISISDNTATDMLIGLVGRDAVEAQMAEWSAHADRNDPFLTTRQMFLLHYAAGLGEQYLATAPDERAAFLAASVDPLPITDIGSGYTDQPAFIEDIEWFASPTDVCGAFAGLQQQAADPALEPLAAVLSQEDAGIGLDPGEWPTVWYKGGSEPGVLTLGWLATDADGATYVVEAMVSDPGAPLAPEAITDLVALAADAFGLVR